jgi:hypothetical protein
VWKRIVPQTYFKNFLDAYFKSTITKGSCALNCKATHLRTFLIYRTVRLEPAFLAGTAYSDPKIRNGFIKMFDKNIPKNLFVRFMYILSIQNWDHLSSTFWIKQAVDLVLGMAKLDFGVPTNIYSSFRTIPLSVFETGKTQTETPKNVSDFFQKHSLFLKSVRALRIADIIRPIKHFIHADPQLAYDLWIELFTLAHDSFGTNPNELFRVSVLLSGPIYMFHCTHSL